MRNVVLLLGLAMLASCSALVEPENAPPVAETYFYPQTNGLQYTYTHDEQNISDTATYQVVVNGNYGIPSRLDKVESDTLNKERALYLFATGQDRTGIRLCILIDKNTNDSIIALRGELVVGNTWKANSSGTITASVEDHYDFYNLAGNTIEYEDVVVVKYVDSRDQAGTFTLRFFANGYGLIHEKRVVESTTDQTLEISNLRLLGRTKTATTTPQTDRWWEAHSRYSIVPDLTPED